MAIGFALIGPVNQEMLDLLQDRQLNTHPFLLAKTGAGL